jgi:hypothetical protein
LVLHEPEAVEGPADAVGRVVADPPCCMLLKKHISRMNARLANVASRYRVMMLAVLPQGWQRLIKAFIL